MIYSVVGSAAVHVQGYQGIQEASSEANNLAVNGEQTEQELTKSKQAVADSLRNLELANTMMGIIYKNIKDLQL